MLISWYMCEFEYICVDLFPCAQMFVGWNFIYFQILFVYLCFLLVYWFDFYSFVSINFDLYWFILVCVNLFWFVLIGLEHLDYHDCLDCLDHLDCLDYLFCLDCHNCLDDPDNLDYLDHLNCIDHCVCLQCFEFA